MLDLTLSLSKVKKDVPVDLWLAKHDLKQFEVGFILLVDINRFFAVATFLDAVVLALKLANDTLVSMATLYAYEEIVLI